MKYDIFISYRRDGGKEKARPLKSELERRGYKVFLDFDELKDGVFDKRVMDAIKNAPIFMIILSKNSLDRCKNDEDWVRKEIEYAGEQQKHIIPINPDKEFKKFPPDIPGTVKKVISQHQFSVVDYEQLFNESIEKMVRDRIEPLISKLHKENNEDNGRGAIIHLETDLYCKVLKFKKEICTVNVGEDKIIRLLKGNHKLEFVSIDNEEGRYSIVYSVEDNDMENIIEIKLKEIKDKRDEAKKRKDFSDSIMADMVSVEGGTFTMGCTNEQGSDCDDDEKPSHRVTLSNYSIGKYEVTVALFRKFIEATNYQTDADKKGGSYIWNGSGWKLTNGVNWRCDASGNRRNSSEDDHPVIHVSWNDVVAFCEWLSKETNQKFRLPTEAEWEFAARGGNKSQGYKYSGSNTIGNVAWYNENSGNKTHPVGQKSHNELGIYDMSGNVWEWCQDWKGGYSSGSKTNPTGASSGLYRVLRGGSWHYGVGNCRVSDRDGSFPDYLYSINGFRLALSL